MGSILACARSQLPPPPPPLSPTPLDEALGHSFCYSGSAGDAAHGAVFRSISGAAVSANSVFSALNASAFETSSSFSALALDNGSFFHSGPLPASAHSGPTPSFSGPLRPKPSRARHGPSDRNRRPWVVPLRATDGVQWAHGRAGEDRVHAVVSKAHHYVFVGIYDGFNGPDAADFLVNNLYNAVFTELRGLFWEEGDADSVRSGYRNGSMPLWKLLESETDDVGKVEFSGSGRFAVSLSKLRSRVSSWRKDRKFAHGNARDCEGIGTERHNICRKQRAVFVADQEVVLEALARALDATERGFMEMIDSEIDSKPELAIMGSCLLVVLMRGDDVYVMNVGDSRAIVARHYGFLVRDDEDCLEIEAPEIEALQLSTDHSTSVVEEVLRIKHDHPGDDQCIINDRVKGRLNITRAFGAAYLKQAKWNEALLEMFRNDFVGTAPYISPLPSLYHYKLGPHDQFLVLSSDGLYQYFTNREVVLYVMNFMENFPDGDPAQNLIEELLSRAAKKAGMDFSELLDVPQGDRRKYHDDITVVVISLEGRIWRSSGKYV